MNSSWWLTALVLVPPLLTFGTTLIEEDAVYPILTLSQGNPLIASVGHPGHAVTFETSVMPIRQVIYE